MIASENLLLAWQDFIKGKRNKKDVQQFERHLMDHIFELHVDLKNKTYRHGPYHAFDINDPKPRNIHKACVRDRLVHHGIYRKLYAFFDKKFIHDSYSCRLNKGVHRAINRFRTFACQVSRNNTKTCYILKCDIRKFFASVNHNILLGILKKSIPDPDILWLLKEIITSFSTRPNVGLPLGNLTSQLLVNIYMNEFDQFMKHKLKIKHYIRYADDFVILSQDKLYLEGLIKAIDDFLQEKLHLELHPSKVYIKTLASGVDFLGWVHFPVHRVLRTITKKRMIKNLEVNSNEDTIQSYKGLLKHGNSHKLQVQYLD